jgi:serine/threonine protein kinase
MATVHRATIELAGGIRREVALKRLLPHLAEDEQFLDDFVREAKLAVHLRHPNIIQIYELGRIGADYFIAMELVRGVSLMSLMRSATKANRLLPVGAVLSLMLELTDALDHAYNGTSAHGDKLHLVHRDLTPSNLLITDDGHIKIIDFGIAKALRGDLQTDSGRAKGKLGYMALEALKAEQVDARADIFSAGVVMWELLTNHRLFKAPDDWDLIGALRETQVAAPSTINPECPPALDDIVLHAVAKLRDERWASAEELHLALAAVARGFAATPNEVVRAKQALRPETSSDPYVGFELEFEIEVDDDEGQPPPRRIEASGVWPAEPVTEPKMRRIGEGSNAWPIEPVTEPKLEPFHHLEERTTDEANLWPPEGPSVSVRELPVTFQPVEFSDTNRTRVPDTARTDRVPTVDESRKARANRAGTKLGAIKPGARRATAPLKGSSTTRKPAPGRAVDVNPFDTQQMETTTEDKAFPDEIDEADSTLRSDDFDEE